jgi:hypothetical protein
MAAGGVLVWQGRVSQVAAAVQCEHTMWLSLFSMLATDLGQTGRHTAMAVKGAMAVCIYRCPPPPTRGVCLCTTTTTWGVCHQPRAAG